jgi:alanyl-tRNA synthetase
VNDKIRSQIPLKEERNVPYQTALTSGVTALFGEKYGDFVRVITFDDHYSKELCGGTHVKNTAQIGLFKIISEGAVAAGVRRIEAITGEKALAFYNEQVELITAVKEKLKAPLDVLKSVDQLIEENAKLKKALEHFELAAAGNIKDELKKEIQTINGIQFLAKKVNIQNADTIKNILFELRAEFAPAFLLLGAEIDEKPHLALIIADQLLAEKGFNAAQIIRELGKEIQGGGGGQPFFATAGGKNVAGLTVAIDKAINFIK